MSAPLNIGVEEILAAALNELQRIEANPEPEDEEIEYFDFETDENDPNYRDIYVSYNEDDNVYVLEGKQLTKIFNSTNFNDMGSLRYLYKYIEKNGAIEKLKEMGLEEGDSIRIQNYEFEYWDEY